MFTPPSEIMPEQGLDQGDILIMNKRDAEEAVTKYGVCCFF